MQKVHLSLLKLHSRFTNRSVSESIAQPLRRCAGDIGAAVTGIVAGYLSFPMRRWAHHPRS
jgi:hypothetical protein